MKKGKFGVERDCCIIGNCIQCFHLPLGKTIRVEQVSFVPREEAEKCEVSFQNYKSQVKRLLTEEKMPRPL